MQINISSQTTIKVEAITDQVHLRMNDLMVGTIPTNLLKKLIKNQLGISERNIQIVNAYTDLIISIENEPNLPSTQVLIDEISAILSRYLPQTLKNRITNRSLIYITKESGIPLLGSIYFGIIDRGTNLIQVRPLTGCLLDCPFCSVDEGPRSKTRFVDYIIGVPYLIEETKKLIDYKGISDIEIHIDGQSEPTLYPYLPELIAEFAKDPRIAIISMQTNGVPLNVEYIQKLEKSGLNRINLSINSLDPKKAKYLAGNSTYDINHILQITKEIAKSSIQLLVSPLWVPGINDADIENIISFVLGLNLQSNFPLLGIQNYLKYKFGRRIPNAKMVNMQKFKEKLHEWEGKYGVGSLYLSPTDFGIHPAKSYPKTFRKGEVTDIEIIIPGRISSKYNNKREMLGMAKNRIIQIMNSSAQIGDHVSIKITNNKDNIYYGHEL